MFITDANAGKGILARPIFDLSRINKCTKRVPWVQPDLQQFLQFAAMFALHFKADFVWGFNQLKLAPETREEFGITFSGKIYEPLAVGFGGSEFPPAFQAEVQTDIQEHEEYCRNYLDDVYAGTKVPAGKPITKDHMLARLKMVRSVLTSLNRRKWLLNWDKTFLVETQMELLGHRIARGIGVEPRRKAAMQDLSNPTNLDEVNSYRRMGVWIRKFVPNLAELVAPLNKYSRKGMTYEMFKNDTSANEAIQYIRKTVSSIEYHAPRSDWDFTLCVDSSDACSAWWLWQEPAIGDDGTPILIDSGYYAFKEDYELFQTVTEKELYALFDGVTGSALRRRYWLQEMGPRQYLSSLS
ncbi:unnamed protein product [Amoebophrya sp. A25]|nr:unnamed protein product [Amoebophrya sp. A25]|eukprot:GSA25T00014728001.1